MAESEKNSRVHATVKPVRKKARLNAAEATVHTAVAAQMERTQLGKFSTKGGTGFAAEDANALIDERAGRKVLRTGQDNAKNGADRIVDGQSIQTKYFESASRSVNDAFDDKGMYRYGEMQLEVPKDQYEAALKLMEKRIKDGKVPGVTDPADAKKLVRQGNVTYAQARNIAKAGNMDSLKYDARNSVVTCSAAFGIGFALEFGAGIWAGEKPIASMKNAVTRGIQTAGLAFFTSVGSAQLMRTQAARTGTVLVKSGLRHVNNTALGKAAIKKIAEFSAGKALKGGAALNHVSKLLRSNAITGAVTIAVITVPDLYRATIAGSISWGQFTKNLVVNGSSVAGGTGGWLAGVALGASAGSAVPVVGTAIGGIVGGLVGAVSGGVAAGYAAKKVADYVSDDDEVSMQDVLNNELIEIAGEHLMTQEEFNNYLNLLQSFIPKAFFRDLYASSNRKQLIRGEYEEYAFELIKKRKTIPVISEEKVLTVLDEILAQAQAEDAISKAKPVSGRANTSIKPKGETASA